MKIQFFSFMSALDFFGLARFVEPEIPCLLQRVNWIGEFRGSETGRFFYLGAKTMCTYCWLRKHCALTLPCSDLNYYIIKCTFTFTFILYLSLSQKNSFSPKVFSNQSAPSGILLQGQHFCTFTTILARILAMICTTTFKRICDGYSQGYWRLIWTNTCSKKYTRICEMVLARKCSRAFTRIFF